MIKKDLISKRYINDGVPLIRTNTLQSRYLNRFLNDRNIKYKSMKKCLICNSENFTLISEKDRYGIPLKTVVCNNCGIIFRLEQMTGKSLKIFYSKYYRRIYDAKDNIDFNEIEKKYGFHSKGKIPSFINKRSVVVEIGCGGGWNLMPYLRERIMHFGFDYDNDYIEYGKKKGLNLFLGGIDMAHRMGIKTDYVLLAHMLEHTENPILFLRDLKLILKKTAIVNIFIPSRNLLLFGGGGTGFDLLGTLQNAHNFLFDKTTIKYVGFQAGFKVLVNIGGSNVVLKNISYEIQVKNITEKKQRGEKIIKYLKFIEKVLPYKQKFSISDDLLYKIFIRLHFRQVLKKIYFFRVKKYRG